MAKDYRFKYPHAFWDERFYFEDGEDEVVISAENPEEATKKFLELVDEDSMEAAESCQPEEIDWDGSDTPHHFVRWSLTNR